MKAKKFENYYLFITEIISLYKKYGFSLGYDRDAENIIIEEYKDGNVEWLKDCEVSPVVVEKMLLEKE
jgi:hypothetical protein